MSNTTLTENVNNNFYEQRNVLTGRTGEVTVLVEDYADEYLWLVVLQSAYPGRLFRVTPYQVGENLSQSKPLIMKEIQQKGGKLYIGCIDSDQSYLLRQHGNAFGAALEQTTYLFHTYAYSRENLLCMPSTLAQVMTAATSLQTTFPFDLFFKDVSNAIYEVFILDLFMRSKGSRTVIGVGKWSYIFPSEKAIKKNLKAGKPGDIISDISKKVKPFERQLTNAPDYNAKERATFEQSLLSANEYVNKDNCCLFVYGHEMMPFVSAVLSSLVEDEVTKEKSRINAVTKMTPEVKAEKIRHIDNQQHDINTVINTNAGFVIQNSVIYQLIKADLAVL